MLKTRTMAAGLAACVLVAWPLPERADAATPTAFSYQGQLKEAGVPYSGTAMMGFSLWDRAIEGRPTSEELILEVELVNGLFNVELDFGGDALRGEPRWLEISVRTDSESALLSPRQPITPVPFALYAFDAPSGGGSPWTVSGPDVYFTPGNVGIGTADPQYKLHAESNDTRARAVFGKATATTGSDGVGVYGYTLGDAGHGVRGYAADSAGTNYAVSGHTASANGYAAHFTGGRNYFEGNVGIGTDEPAYPLHAELHANSGRAVYGKATATATTGTGVYGQADAGSGRAVVAYASSEIGTNFALVASTESDSGYAGYFLGGRTYFQRRVGIGTPTPAHALDVNGDVEADSFMYSTPREKQIAISGFAFSPQTSEVGFVLLDGIRGFASETVASFVAPVTLPHGATVTRLTADVYDATASAYVSVYLKYLAFPESGGETLAEVTSSGSSGYQTLIDNTIATDAVVDNSSEAYYVVLTSDDWMASLRLRVVTITYTVEETE